MLSIMKQALAALAIALTIFAAAGVATAQEAVRMVETAEQSAASTAPTATTAPDQGSPTLDELVKSARAAGATILIDGRAQSAPTDGVGADPAAALESAVAVRLAVAETLARIPAIPGALADAAINAQGDGSANWLWLALALTLVALAVAMTVWWLVWRWAQGVLTRLETRPEPVPAPRTSYVLLRTVLSLVADAALLVSGAAFIVLVVPSPGPVRATALAVLVSIATYRFVTDMLTALFLPDRPHERLLRIDDATATRMLRRLKIIAAIGYTILALSLWSSAVGVDQRTVDALRILGSGLAVVLLVLFLIVHRDSITAMVRGTSQRPNTFRKFLSALWPFIAIGYLLVAGTIHIAGVVANKAPQAGPIVAPIVATIVALAFYGVCVIVLARRFNATEATLRATLRPAPAEPTRMDETPVPTTEVAAGTDPAGEVVPVEPVEPELEPLLVWQDRWHALFRRLAGLAAVVIGAAVVVMALDIPQVASAASNSLGLVVVLFALWGVYDAMRTWVDGKMEDEMPSHAGGHGEVEDGMGPGATRLATLLPLLRNLLIVTMFTFMAAVGLAALGVNVAPLFAGAGVLGLAIGFGAQTLIRDVFSGAFFLADDAFRKGEFIDVGGTMGAVEKISVRSFQLRHQNGPLHTIPFGEIKQLTNFSRDWVVMKLPLRIPYGTDVERVRKLIKKLGERLLQDEEIGPLFLAPLKSQGVIEMDDSAMILRVKFMTKPGDQFVVRRHVFTEINDLFEREGIPFAHRYVTVRIDPQGRELTPEEEEQAASAAAEHLYNQEQKKA